MIDPKMLDAFIYGKTLVFRDTNGSVVEYWLLGDVLMSASSILPDGWVDCRQGVREILKLMLYDGWEWPDERSGCD